MADGGMPNGLAPLGTKQTKTRDDWRLEHEVEAMLEWFWCYGGSLFEKSTFGVQLARAELESSGSITCGGCGGNGFPGGDTTQFGNCEPCKGWGIVWFRHTSKTKGVVYATDFCTRCDTTKKRQKIEEGFERLRQLGALLDVLSARCGVTRQAPPLSPHCHACGGSGYVETHAVTMQGDPAESMGIAPDTSAIERYAVVSRWLKRLDAEHGRTLERYYGMVGLHWGRGGREDELNGCDRYWAIIPLTPAGRTLLAKIKNPLAITPNELLENLVASQKLRRDDIKAQQLSRAHLQSVERHRDACTALKEVIYRAA
jgi:hypothetical protein